jgi:hypothetical protein
MVTHETTAHVMLNPKMAHADFLFSPATQDRILAAFAEVRAWVWILMAQAAAAFGACLGFAGPLRPLAPTS